MNTLHFIALMTTLFLTRQLTQAQVRLAMKAGVNLATVDASSQQASYSPKSRVDFQGGLLVDWLITKSFSIQPAMLISSKGTRLYESHMNNQTGANLSTLLLSIKLVYAEVPILAVFKRQMSQSCRIYGGLGPYLGVGLGGSQTSPSILISDPSLHFGSGQQVSQAFRRFDYGASIAIGLDVKWWELGLTYNHGLIDVGGSIPDAYNRTLSITVGIWLNKL